MGKMARRTTRNQISFPSWQPGTFLSNERVLRMSTFEIHHELTVAHGNECDDLSDRAVAALHRRDYKRAETLLQRALKMEPDAVDLPNNLANAWFGQGRLSEGRALLKTILQRQPDYPFARLTLASMEIQAGRLDAGQEMLDKVMALKRLHYNAFAMLCDQQIRLLIQRRNVDAAGSWLKLMLQGCPEHTLTKAWTDLL